MNAFKLLLIYILTFASFASNARSEFAGGQVSGKVLDKATNKPIEFATVRIFKETDSTLVTGGVTDLDGKFKVTDVPAGRYYLLINFISYKELKHSNIKLTNNQRLDLGDLKLSVDAQQLKAVEITSEYQSVEYQIDKKVISVDKQLTTGSMSAVEVLENVPSINVDIDGNVSLRGSSGFVVLIDGKPTVLEPSDALRQIPASTILNIEIITNPSSKYVPDGTGGIINIITKQNRNRGVSGIVNVRGGSFGTYGGDILLNYKKGKSNFYVGGDYRNRIRPSTSFSERRTTVDDITTTIISDGTSERNRGGWSFRAGWDWDATKKDVFSLGVRLGDYVSEGNSRLAYATSESSSGSVLNEYSRGDWERRGEYINLTGNYVHKFSKKKEELALQVNFRARDGDEKNQSLLYDGSGENVTNGSFITESGPSKRWNIRLDYTKPLGKDFMIEAGSQLRFNDSDDNIGLYDFDQTEAGFVLQPDKSNSINYKRAIYGFYGVFRGKLKDLGYQLGLRTEYTKRDVSSITASSTSTIDRLDFFPTLHFSYELPNDHQVMANYSRRIDRPRGWNLEPFITWTDLFNVRQGNPDLLPEYIDAFELNYVKNWEKSRLSVESYYRITNNRINRITSVYDEGILLSRFENVGVDYALGIEMMYSQAFTDWWEVTISANTFNYKVRGELEGVSFDNNSFNWRGRMAHTFKLMKNLRLQLNGRYNSPTATAQGEDRGFYVINAGIRADFLDRKLSTSLQVRDIFASATRASLVESATLYNYRSRLANAPNIAFNISYRFNNFKQKRKGNDNDGGDEDF